MGVNLSSLLPLLVLASAGVRAAGDGDWQACRRVADDRERLACYDHLAAAEPASPEELFGLDARASEQRLQAALGVVPPAELTATVRAVTRTAEGKLDLLLANGQRWVQVDSGALKVTTGDAVHIRPATLGSFLLQRAGTGRGIRVRRVADEAPVSP